jgi:hypothetical protein
LLSFSDKRTDPLEIEGKQIRNENEHENITMTCKAHISFTAPSWLNHDNRLITNTSRLRIIVKESSFDYTSHLMIFDAQTNDSGKYACEAMGKDGKKEVKSTTLNVFGKKKANFIFNALFFAKFRSR